MSEGKLYKIPGTWKKHAFIDAEGYRETYQQSVRNPKLGASGKRIDWFTPYSKVKNTSFAAPDVFIKWFEDGVTNVAHNCVDRHLEEATRRRSSGRETIPITTRRSAIATP